MVVQSSPWLVAIPLMFSCFYINFNGMIKNASSINLDISQLDESVSYDLCGMHRFHMIAQKVLLLESLGQLGIDNGILSIGFLYALMFLIVIYSMHLNPNFNSCKTFALSWVEVKSYYI